MPVVQPVTTRTALWLIGHGVSASPSPAMQNAALRACGLDWEYAIRDVHPAELRALLDDLRSGAARGANVTIPHKRAVAAACDSLVGDAAVTGAVNTVVVEADGRLVGENTDARGLEGALRTLGLWPSAPDVSVVVLGAGGAAAAAVLAMSRLDRRPQARFRVVARRPDAVDGLVASMGVHVPGLTAGSWDTADVTAALHEGSASIVINATPASLQDLPLDLDALPQRCTVVDLRYRPRPVDLVAAAHSRGLRAGDGLEMLLHQGMLSFERWTGCTPPWDAARAALRQAVGE